MSSQDWHAFRLAKHKTFCIGRDPDNDLVLDDATVSRRHVRIKLCGKALLLTDAGSMNGTLLELDDGRFEKLTQHGAKTRIPSARLRVGSFHVEIRLGKRDSILARVERGNDTIGALPSTDHGDPSSMKQRFPFSLLRRSRH